jgi:hypothetical protein
MDSHPLLRAVTSWPGRRSTELAFEALGFTLHRTWQNRIIQFCGEEKSALLNRYWDDTALETMQSLGRSSPDQRAFTIQPTYCSPFLDELFTARDFLEPNYPYPRLIACLFYRAKRILTDPDFREGEVAFFDAAQRAEIDRLEFDTTGWSGRKRDVIPFADKVCSGLGFAPRRRTWRKTIAGQLVFEVGVDLGGNPYCITPPLKFSIFHTDDRTFLYEMQGGNALDRLVPGLNQYARCDDASSYVLGIRAQIELFNVIVGQFEQ